MLSSIQPVVLALAVASALPSLIHAQITPSTRPDLRLDLDSDGTVDFVVSTSYTGFSPETPNLLGHFLKTQGANQVWVVTSTGLPVKIDTEGTWTPSVAGEAGWASSTGSGFVLQDFVADPGDPRFGGGLFRREGALSRITDGVLDHPTPHTYVVVRFGTASGWRLGWLHLSTFKAIYTPWNPGPFSSSTPAPPADVRLLDMGQQAEPGTPSVAVGANSTWPESGISLSRWVHPVYADVYLRASLHPARAWETLEMAPRFDATTWARVGTLGGVGEVPLRLGENPEDTSPKFFRLR